MPAAVAVCGVLPRFSRCILPVVPTKGDKATATMADIKSETEMRCPEELPEYSSAAPTIKTDNTEAGAEHSGETESVHEMGEGVPKANKAITENYDHDLKSSCYITRTLISCACALAFAIGMFWLIVEKTG